jgi:hypothetical protein
MSIYNEASRLLFLQCCLYVLCVALWLYVWRVSLVYTLFYVFNGSCVCDRQVKEVIFLFYFCSSIKILNFL